MEFSGQSGTTLNESPGWMSLMLNKNYETSVKKP